MSLQFWQNRPFRFCSIFFLLLVGNILLSDTAFSARKKSSPLLNSKVPGVAKSLQQLLKINREQIFKLYTKLNNAPKLIADLPNVEEIRIDPYFLKSVLLYSTQRYISLIKSDNLCTFYSLLENGLIRSNEKRITKIPIIYKTKKGDLESAIVLKHDLLRFIYQTKCYQTRDMSAIFSIDSFEKTVNNISYDKPTSEKDCSEILTNWKANPYLPYLCKIPEVIARANKVKLQIDNSTLLSLRKDNINGSDIRLSKLYLEKIKPKELSYIRNLCFNLENENTFCELYLHADIWRKVISKDLPNFHMDYICKNILKKEIINSVTRFECYEHIIQNKSLCSTKGANDFPALFPKPACDYLASIKGKGNLYSDYHDCPGRIDNEGTTNIHRILAHLDKKHIPSTTQNCLGNTNNSLVKLIYDFKHTESWPLKICYDDKIKEKEVCLPYTPGDVNKEIDSNIAETVVVRYIIERVTQKPVKKKCSIIPENEYSPQFLKYKTGCFITYKKAECTTIHCPKKIILNTKEIKGKLRYEGDQTYQYFPTSLSNDYYSIDNMLRILKKIKSHKIKNLTHMTSFLKKDKNNIIHGIGCAEDIHPTHFKKIAFNQCRPLPFIIDGTIKSKIKPMIMIRTAIMDIHSPIKIDWNNIYNAVKNYQELHPKKLWTLYGIEKK